MEIKRVNMRSIECVYEQIRKDGGIKPSIKKQDERNPQNLENKETRNFSEVLEEQMKIMTMKK